MILDTLNLLTMENWSCHTKNPRYSNCIAMDPIKIQTVSVSSMMKSKLGKAPVSCDAEVKNPSWREPRLWSENIWNIMNFNGIQWLECGRKQSPEVQNVSESHRLRLEESLRKTPDLMIIVLLASITKAYRNILDSQHLINVGLWARWQRFHQGFKLLTSLESSAKWCPTL